MDDFTREELQDVIADMGQEDLQEACAELGVQSHGLSADQIKYEIMVHYDRNHPPGGGAGPAAGYTNPLASANGNYAGDVGHGGGGEDHNELIDMMDIHDATETCREEGIQIQENSLPWMTAALRAHFAGRQIPPAVAYGAPPAAPYGAPPAPPGQGGPPPRPQAFEVDNGNGAPYGNGAPNGAPDQHFFEVDNGYISDAPLEHGQTYHSGPLIKMPEQKGKPRKRHFELHAASLKYFNKEGPGKKQLGTITGN